MTDEDKIYKIYQKELNDYCNNFNIPITLITYEIKYFLKIIADMKLEIQELKEFKNSVLKSGIGYFENFSGR